MLSPVVRAPGLVTGERLTVEEFLRRWEELPKLKNAELIDGVVLLPGPSRQSESTSFGECSKWRLCCSGAPFGRRSPVACLSGIVAGRAGLLD
jgi:hypothetical protein